MSGTSAFQVPNSTRSFVVGWWVEIFLNEKEYHSPYSLNKWNLTLPKTQFHQISILKSHQHQQQVHKHHWDSKKTFTQLKITFFQKKHTQQTHLPKFHSTRPKTSHQNVHHRGSKVNPIETLLSEIQVNHHGFHTYRFAKTVSFEHRGWPAWNCRFS